MTATTHSNGVVHVCEGRGIVRSDLLGPGEAHHHLSGLRKGEEQMRLKLTLVVAGAAGRRRRRCCDRRSRAGDRSGHRADGVLRRAQLRRGRSRLRDCAGGRAERGRRLRPAPEPQCESGIRIHTHPGPVVATVRSGSLTYQDAGPNAWRNRTYTAGQRFVDPGFGHVHRVIAGPAGAEIYSTFFLPPGSENHIVTAPGPEECT